jgi:hypothetical protein
MRAFISHILYVAIEQLRQKWNIDVNWLGSNTGVYLQDIRLAKMFLLVQ